MTKVHFVFRKKQNSFSVYVKNLEKLSVAEIQSIEFFVSARKGIFDFEAYTFIIPKNLEFNDFVFLLTQLSHINFNKFTNLN